MQWKSALKGSERAKVVYLVTLTKPTDLYNLDIKGPVPKNLDREVPLVVVLQSTKQVVMYGSGRQLLAYEPYVDAAITKVQKRGTACTVVVLKYRWTEATGQMSLTFRRTCKASMRMQLGCRGPDKLVQQ